MGCRHAETLAPGLMTAAEQLRNVSKSQVGKPEVAILAGCGCEAAVPEQALSAHELFQNLKPKLVPKFTYVIIDCCCLNKLGRQSTR